MLQGDDGAGPASQVLLATRKGETEENHSGVTLMRRCTYRPSVIYLIANKRLSLSLALSLSLSFLL